MILSRPGLSVKRMSPFGRKAMLHGLSRPSASVTTRIFCVSVVNSRLCRAFCRGLAGKAATSAAMATTKQIVREVWEYMDSRGTRAMGCSQRKIRVVGLVLKTPFGEFPFVPARGVFQYIDP